jgi:hypothetical protein
MDRRRVSRVKIKPLRPSLVSPLPAPSSAQAAPVPKEVARIATEHRKK